MLSIAQSMRATLWPLLVIVSITLPACSTELVKQTGNRGSRPVVADAAPPNSRPPNSDVGVAAFNRGDYQFARFNLEPRAAAGDREAQFLLGRMYSEGSVTSFNDVPHLVFEGIIVRPLGSSKSGNTISRDEYNEYKDYAAKHYMVNAARQGHRRAQVYLGNMYLRDKNYEEAEKWYKMAAEQGDADAHIGLGRVYENRHVDREEEAWDYEEFFEYYEKLLCPLQGESGAESNLKKAIWHYKKAACPGHHEARLRLALVLMYNVYVAGENYHREIAKNIAILSVRASIELLRSIVGSKSRPAAHSRVLGIVYGSLGQVIDEAEEKRKLLDRAETYLRESAEKNDLEAQYELSYFLLNRYPDGEKEDEQEYWLNRAADRGHIGALHLRGRSKFNEEMIQEIVANDTIAQANYGAVLSDFLKVAYSDGEPTGHYPTLRKFRERRANRGRILEAREYLSIMFESGFGVEPDREEADYWKKLAKSGEEQKLRLASSGSGLYVLGDYILTNEHVVDECKEVRIPHGRAQIVKLNEQTDLALLKTRAGQTSGVRAIIRPTWTKVGEEVFAFGYPLAHHLSLEGNFADGVVSAPVYIGGENQEIQLDPEYQYQNMFQHTAATHPGNSGGPLLDRSGKVIGVNTRVYRSGDLFEQRRMVAQNINFAVSAWGILKFLWSFEPEYVEIKNTKDSAAFKALLEKAKKDQGKTEHLRTIEEMKKALWLPEAEGVLTTKARNKYLNILSYAALPDRPSRLETEDIAAYAQDIAVRITCWQEPN